MNDVYFINDYISFGRNKLAQDIFVTDLFFENLTCSRAQYCPFLNGFCSRSGHTWAIVKINRLYTNIIVV